MRAPHTAHPFPAFPVYSCAFLADDQFVAGGGGGASRTGIKNKLRLFRVSDDRQLTILSELELENGEDAPMSMAAHIESRTLVCGINSSAAKLEKGENENCRKFAVSGDEHKMTQLVTRGTLSSGNAEDYQRVTVLSPDGRSLVVAGEHDFSLLAYESLSPISLPVHVTNGEIYDATLSSSHVILTTSSSLLVYSLPTLSAVDSEKSPKPKKKGKQKSGIKSSGSGSSLRELKLVKTIGLPSIPGVPSGSSVTFRVARLHPLKHNTLYTVVNVTLPRAPKAKAAKKQAYVLRWEITSSLEDDSFNARVETIRKTRDGNLTCFDVSRDGKFLAFGASDYSLGVLDSTTLAPLLSILKAHEFPVTTVRFNPTSNLLVSGGVDSSLRVVSISEKLGGQSWSLIIVFIVLAILVVIIGIMMRK
ncbi:quinon protein alcohol dehydrogenase-like superfamily [Melanogaster broomeanus]|nr:quinon protein alcohol dehydrogenase-like superfamily [Melanogaster broomeanus]